MRSVFRHTSSVTASPVPSAFVRLGSFVRRLGPEPPAARLASYVQRLRGYGFDCSPILRKFVACGVALTEDMVRLRRLWVGLASRPVDVPEEG